MLSWLVGVVSGGIGVGVVCVGVCMGQGYRRRLWAVVVIVWVLVEMGRN